RLNDNPTSGAALLPPRFFVLLVFQFALSSITAGRTRTARPLVQAANDVSRETQRQTAARLGGTGAGGAAWS
ncbi:MAG: hypothetical protein WCL34_14260, partial [Methylococcaceae bacterium]